MSAGDTEHVDRHFGGQQEEPEDGPEQLVGVGGDVGAGVQRRVGCERHRHQTPAMSGHFSQLYNPLQLVGLLPPTASLPFGRVKLENVTILAMSW